MAVMVAWSPMAVRAAEPIKPGVLEMPVRQRALPSGLIRWMASDFGFDEMDASLLLAPIQGGISRWGSAGALGVSS